jgi:hypothetical protein
MGPNNIDFKTTFTKKLKMVLDLATPAITDKDHPTLDEAFNLLGRCHTRLMVLDEIHELIKYTLCVMIPMWPQELWDQRELILKQKTLAEKLIKTLYYHQEKETIHA